MTDQESPVLDAPSNLAEALLAFCRDADKTDIRLFVALEDLERGEYKRAEERSRSVVLRFPRHASGLSVLGASLLGLERYTEASENLLAATRLDEGLVFSRYTLASCYSKMHRDRKALQSLEEAIALAEGHLERASAEASLPQAFSTTTTPPSSSGVLFNVDDACDLNELLVRMIERKEQLQFLLRESSSAYVANDIALFHLSDAAIECQIRQISAESRGGEQSLSTLRAIIEARPQLLAARLVLVRLLIDTKPCGAPAVQEAFSNLVVIIRERPWDTESLVDYMVLLQRVQMGREQSKTHNQGSLSDQITKLGVRVLALSPNHVEALRLLSIQYRYGGEFARARSTILAALKALLKGIRRLAAIAAEEASSSISFPANNDDDDLTLEDLRFSEEEFLDVVRVPAALMPLLSDELRMNLRQWVSYSRTDLGYINYHEALALGDDADLLSLAEEDFTVALAIMPTNYSALSGQARVSESRDEENDCVYWLRRSFAVLPTPYTREALRARNLDTTEY